MSFSFNTNSATSGQGLGTTTPGTTGGFGFTNLSASKPTTSFSFGAQPTTTATSFGQPSTGFSFGQPANTATGNIGTFGTSGTPGFSFSQPSNMQTSLRPGTTTTWSTPTTNQLSIFSEPIKEIKKRYAPYVDGLGNPHATATDLSCRPNQDCKFSTIHYRKYDSVSTTTNMGLLDIPRGEEIDSNNPDPEKYFAVREYGIKELLNRFDNQSKLIERDTSCVSDLRDIVEYADKKKSSMSSRFEALRANFSQLQFLLLRILRKIEIIRHRGIPLQNSEIKYRENLDKLISSLQGPNKKLQELLVLESQLDHRRENYVDSVCEEDLTTLYNLLEKQKHGIEVLTDIIKKDTHDLDIISKGLKKGHSKVIK